MKSLLLTAPLVLLFSGCIAIPMGRSSFNSLPLTGGVSKPQFPTKSSVLQSLGPPDWIFFNGMLIAYEGIFYTPPAVGISLIGLGPIRSTSYPTRFIFAFDENGPVLGRHFESIPMWYGAGSNIERVAVKTASRHHIPLEPAPADAGHVRVYFYNGFPDATRSPRWKNSPVRIRVNGQNMLALDSSSLVYLTLEPGDYSIVMELEKAVFETLHNPRSRHRHRPGAHLMLRVPPLSEIPDGELLVEILQTINRRPKTTRLSAETQTRERLAELKSQPAAKEVRRGYANLALEPGRTEGR